MQATGISVRLGGGDDIEGRGSRVEGLQGAMSDGGEEDESGAAPRAADDEAASAEEEEAAAAGGGDAEEEGGEKGEGGDGSRSSSDGEGCAVRLFAFAITRPRGLVPRPDTLRTVGGIVDSVWPGWGRALACT